MDYGINNNRIILSIFVLFCVSLRRQIKLNDVLHSLSCSAVDVPMESLDILNLRAGECSFLVTALADVKRYINTFILENKTNVVLIFPPFSARNRFLVHSLVQQFHHELNTISIGSSHGRRLVVYHSSIKPMLCEPELEGSEKHDENHSSIHQLYRTPKERKAQEKLFQSLMPKKLEPSTRSTPRKQYKRPDIPIYIPKALRGLANNAPSNTNSKNISLNSTPSNKLDANSSIRNDSNNTSYSKNNMINSISLSNHNQQNNTVASPIDSFKCVDSLNDILIDDINNKFQTSYYDEFSESLSSIPDLVNINECNSSSSVTNKIVKTENSNLEHNKLDSSIVKTKFKNSDSVSLVDDNVSCISVENSIPENLTNCQLSKTKDKFTPDNVLVTQKTTETIDLKVVDNVLDTSNKELHEELEEHNVVVSRLTNIELNIQHDTICRHYSLDGGFTSEPLIYIDENLSKRNEELSVQKSLVLINKSQEILETNENEKGNKKKKKKILDVEECSWEDMYDKEEDYIHPLLMKELVSTIGNVKVKCTKEDYRSHQTIEERSGDGECVIEVYGFSSDLKTIDLMNQFAEFRNNHLEIIWVDDTHALAVFESPNIADRVLNTPLVLVKTRPLKHAIKESKIRAALVVPLPATRPKTCTAMARRLVSSALGLKVNVSPDLINAERTLLANAKEKKIRDAQQKHNMWNSES